MAKRKQKKNGERKTDNTMAKRKETIQWLKENREYNS
jgi:hypothetical protein